MPKRNDKKETLYHFSVIYVEEQSNLGLFYQESLSKSTLDAEDTTHEDILTRIMEDFKGVTLQVVDGRLMVVWESQRFTFTEDLEGDSCYSLAVVPADDEEQIPFPPNITEEAGHGMRPFWYDGSGMRKVADFNNFVEVFGTDDEFFDEVKSVVQNEKLVFYPQYLCFEEQEVEHDHILSHTREIKVAVK